MMQSLLGRQQIHPLPREKSEHVNNKAWEKDKDEKGAVAKGLFPP